MTARPPKLSLLMRNRIEDLASGIDAVEALLDQWQVHSADRAQVLVIVDEIASNIINSAWPAGEARCFTFDVSLEPSSPSMLELELMATDDGVPFDPTVPASFDPASSLDEREPGGLGLFLVQRMSDTVEYRRVGDQNHLRVTKRLRRTPCPV